MAVAEVTLPNGYWYEGSCLRHARVKAMDERAATLDELFAPAALPVERVSTILARCITHLEGRACEGLEQLRELTLGDREALLLHIHRLTFGDDMACTLPCPSCSKVMDFQLQSHRLILHVPEPQQEYFEESFLLDATRLQVRFRLPRGSDIETALHQCSRTTEDAAIALLRRCIDWVRQDGAQNGEENISMAHCPAQLSARISERMAELDPQAETMLQMECPSCGHGFKAPFDAADYLVRELAARERQLFCDVHTLALAYHWSESEILNMTPRKRKLYLELLDGGASGG